MFMLNTFERRASTLALKSTSMAAITIDINTPMIKMKKIPFFGFHFRN